MPQGNPINTRSHASRSKSREKTPDPQVANVNKNSNKATSGKIQIVRKRKASHMDATPVKALENISTSKSRRVIVKKGAPNEVMPKNNTDQTKCKKVVTSIEDTSSPVEFDEELDYVDDLPETDGIQYEVKGSEFESEDENADDHTPDEAESGVVVLSKTMKDFESPQQPSTQRDALLDQLLEEQLKRMKPDEIKALLKDKGTPLPEVRQRATPPAVKSPSDTTIYKPAFLVRENTANETAENVNKNLQQPDFIDKISNFVESV